MDKSQYRQMMLNTRISSDEINNCINKKLVNFLSNYESKHIAGYIAMRKEVDILPSLAYFSKQCSIYMPSIVNQKQALIFKPWSTQTQLRSSLYGTLEPNVKANCSPDFFDIDLDIMLIPCVGVFKQESSIYRIGYGGGFYDRTIAELKKINSKFKTIGIFHQSHIPNNKEIAINADCYDMPLDYIITP